MDDRNDMHTPDEQREPVELPTEGTEPEIKPIRAATKKSRKKTDKKAQGIKIAYAITLILAFGGALTARLITENSMQDLSVSLPSEEVTQKAEDNITLYTPTEEPDFEVRQNLTDIPDTREETEREQTTQKPTEVPTEETTEASKYAVPYDDYYTLPLGTEITKDYSPDKPIYNATLGDWRTHNAIDFKGPDGAQVVAISYGTVKEVYEDTLYGTVVEIDHGNEVTAKYCGFNKDTVEVKKGDTVKGGTLIGYLGTVPCEKTDLSHLHFEIYYKGDSVEPLELMGK